MAAKKSMSLHGAPSGSPVVILSLRTGPIAPVGDRPFFAIEEVHTIGSIGSLVSLTPKFTCKRSNRSERSEQSAAACQAQRFVRQLAGSPTLGLPDGISFFNDRSPLEVTDVV